ncbi:MAG: phosphohistidine phosphatase SixA [Deltaproteobacteria bacterium]|nr:phosphohistidine phosphatase SixA [Deltaproteobacteria bacterium]
MRLYLVRHGAAKSELEDPQRPLTAAGRRDVERVAAWLARLELPVGAVWHSGKARARETAASVSGAVVGAAAPVEHPGLQPNDAPDGVQAEIEHGARDLMIVGHLPFLGRLASLLLAGWTEGVVIDFQPGGVVCLERADTGTPRGLRWGVRWAVAPALLP